MHLSSSGELRFVQSAQAFSTQIHALASIPYHDGHPLDVGLPFPLGAAARPGYVVPKLRPLAAKVALGHIFHLTERLCGIGVYRRNQSKQPPRRWLGGCENLAGPFVDG